MPVHRLRLPVLDPYDLPLVVRSHGWYQLAPHHWEPTKACLTTTLDVGRRAVDVAITQNARGLAVTVTGRTAVTETELRRVRAAVERMLLPREDLTDFWALCRDDDRLAWLVPHGGGRMMRSPTLFEDLVKILFTTNCSWAATRNMATNLVDSIGRRGPSGRRAFPGAKACAALDEAFLGEVVRCGYRVPSFRALANGFAKEGLSRTLEENVATDELRRRFASLGGFGPYAAGLGLRLVGRYDDLALDSACRAKLAERSARGRAPSDRAVERRYRKYGRFAGLALWMDLTSDWHSEAGAPTS